MLQILKNAPTLVAVPGIRPWIVKVCADVRLASGLDFYDILVSHPPSAKRPKPVTLERWEAGDTQWPQDIDIRVGAYAKAASCDPIDLWERAVTEWRASQASEAEREKMRAMEADRSSQVARSKPDRDTPATKKRATRTQDVNGRRPPKESA